MNEEPRERFSRRHGHSPPTREIAIREDAPEELRAALLQIAVESSLDPSNLREIICCVLRKLPDPSNWSEYPNIWNEVQRLIKGCAWFRVYDIAEAIYEHLLPNRYPDRASKFEEFLNDYFREAGIGWQLIDGVIQTRGPEAFESSVRHATDTLNAADHLTASNELHEALKDLSRRPDPDVTGAIQHAMAALECVARDFCGNQKVTLGKLLQLYPQMLPQPLDTVVDKAWGYASEMARHLREGRTPNREEAELIVGLAATIATYLANKSAQRR